MSTPPLRYTLFYVCLIKSVDFRDVTVMNHESENVLIISPDFVLYVKLFNVTNSVIKVHYI